MVRSRSSSPTTSKNVPNFGIAVNSQNKIEIFTSVKTVFFSALLNEIEKCQNKGFFFIGNQVRCNTISNEISRNKSCNCDFKILFF